MLGSRGNTGSSSDDSMKFDRLKYRETWCDQIDDLFSIDNYLERFYFAESRLDAARENVRKLHDPVHLVPGGKSSQAL